jgi:tRNA pseudouridine38-40 synthase
MKRPPSIRDFSGAGGPPGGAARFNYKIILAYDGTAYAGWQLQAGRVPTVQGALERALTRFTGQARDALVVQGAARTDAGVHARSQAAQFYCARKLDPAGAARALNVLLPSDVRVLRLDRVPIDYNVRFTLAKTYVYDLHLDTTPDPFTARYRHAPAAPDRVDLRALEAAAREFVGEHDFSAFSSASEDGWRRSPVRWVTRLDVAPLPGGARLEVSGEGFLFKQVRHMVGALLAAATGRLGPEDIAAALQQGDAAARAAATARLRQGSRMYTVAEAKGLCLWDVALPACGDPDQRMYPQGAPLMRRADLLAARASEAAAPPL